MPEPDAELTVAMRADRTPAVVDGSEREPCASCGEDVWVSPMTRRSIGRGLYPDEIRCLTCVGVRAMPERTLAPGGVEDLFDESSLSDVTRHLAAQLVAERDRQIQAAVRATDWSETAVLRIVLRQPGPMEPITPGIEVHRYPDRAPPIGEHADGEHTSEVMTVTRPLLERFAEAGGRIEALLEDDTDA